MRRAARGRGDAIAGSKNGGALLHSPDPEAAVLPLLKTAMVSAGSERTSLIVVSQLESAESAAAVQFFVFRNDVTHV